MGAARNVVDQAFAAMAEGDINRLVGLVTPDCDWAEAGTRLQGPEQLRAMMEGYFTAFPDFRLAILDAVEAGNVVAAETRFTGTQTGPLHMPSGEIPPTGKAVTLEGCDYIKVEGDKIASWHTYFNMAAFMAQLGLL